MLFIVYNNISYLISSLILCLVLTYFTGRHTDKLTELLLLLVTQTIIATRCTPDMVKTPDNWEHDNGYHLYELMEKHA